jgi:hypothetical protein
VQYPEHCSEHLFAQSLVHLFAHEVLQYPIQLVSHELPQIPAQDVPQNSTHNPVHAPLQYETGAVYDSFSSLDNISFITDDSKN